MGGEGRTSQSLQRRVFTVLTLMAVVASTLVVIVMALLFQNAIVRDAHEQLGRECEIVASIEDDSPNIAVALEDIDFGDVRVTIIDPAGDVVYDNQVEANRLPNHADRSEVAEALETGHGSAERRSESVGYVSIYEAMRLPSGKVVRLSEDKAGVLALLYSSMLVVLAFLAGVVAVSWIVSFALSRHLVRPILEIDPSKVDAESPYRELEPLVSHLKTQQRQLVDQMEQLQDADLVRQEFTANVTHELKTPISSIMGASELIRDGIARPEDVQDFAGRINSDARRLSSLVSDILTLSKLDETERSRDLGVLGQSQRVDLYALAHDACDRMEERARGSRVILTLDGESETVMGYPRLLDELVGNLVSNAIRYNVPGGLVAVTVGRRGGEGAGGHPYVRVADTGIGIPEEDQAKVFERFYRVDKSRSRASGGTGLGLAIVKHAAKVHGATVTLKSQEHKGTTVEVDFPAADSDAAGARED